MADQYHENTPIVGNVILDDVGYSAEIFGFYKDCFENFCEGWNNTSCAALYPDTLSSEFNLFGGSSQRTGATKKLDYKKAFIL